KKQKFRGNQYSDEQCSIFASTSAAKLQKSGDRGFDVHSDPTMNYCIVQFALVFFCSLQIMLNCKQCNNDVVFTKYGQRGLQFKLGVKCLCEERYVNSYPMIGTGYEIVKDLVITRLAMHAPTLLYRLALMDLGQGLNFATYYRIIDSISTAVKTVFESERCLGSNTQNNNESFNSSVWNTAPKRIFCGKTILEIAAHTAACIFNEGFDPILKIMELMGITIGPDAVRFVETRNKERIRIAKRRAAAPKRPRREE
ncbi:hypothetical protein WH47_09449, partial [Habropoda laboriosa]